MANSSAAGTSPKAKDESIGKRIANSRLVKFLRESYYETTKKASWPSPKELRQFTMVVIVALLIVGLWIFILDTGMTQIVRFLGQRL